MNLNRVLLTGNLTADPEFHPAENGTSAWCRLRVAVNGRRKDGDVWVEKPNYFSATAFGRQAEVCGEHLRKGRAVAIDGRLDWHQWTAEGDVKRSAVSIVIDSIQFIGPRPADAGRADLAEAAAEAAPSAIEPPPEPVPAGVGAETTPHEEIPF